MNSPIAFHAIALETNKQKDAAQSPTFDRTSRISDNGKVAA
jgi:hypothetical protein